MYRSARPLAPLLLAMLSACTLGPDYAKPDVSVPATFRYKDGWRPARPADNTPRDAWWRAFDDPELNRLIAQLDVDNANIHIAEAQLRQALAGSDAARARLFPVLTADASLVRGQANGQSPSNALAANTAISWELDLWGRLRRERESSDALAAASTADLEAARLSARALLAQNYFDLRITDALRGVYAQTIQAYQRALDLTRNRMASGVATRADVLQAETQLKTAQAQELDLTLAREQLENAIAVQLGKAPAAFSIAPAALTANPPATPEVLPSELLERRPDVAAAERRAAAANAQIGVAQAALYPDLSLSARGGYRGASFTDWFNLPNRFWSLGPELALTVFDGGARRAASDRSTAAFDATVAAYRQTVLTAFQQVEDNLAASRILEEEERLQRESLAGARESLTIVTNQYKAGTVNYLNVVQAQATALANERSVLQLQGRRLSTAVALVRSTGGGWRTGSATSNPLAAN